MLGLAGSAQAYPVAPVVVPSGTFYGGVGPLEGGLDLSYGADFRAVMDILYGTVTAYGQGTLSSSMNANGEYTQLDQFTPITAMTIDTGTSSLVSYASTGGMTLVAPAQPGLSIGGAITVTDLSVDLSNKAVYATLIGANGVGTLNNVQLFDFSSAAVGSLPGWVCIPEASCSYPPLTVTGLSLTSGGYNLISQSLGLASLGKAALAAVSDFGVLTTVPVPEPSSYLLMGVGLVGMVIRRRAL
jgi:hypothetical protein